MAVSCGAVKKWEIMEDKDDLVRFVLQTEVGTFSDDKISSPLPGTGEGEGHPHKGIRHMGKGRVFLFAASQLPLAQNDPYAKVVRLGWQILILFSYIQRVSNSWRWSWCTGLLQTRGNSSPSEERVQNVGVMTITLHGYHEPEF